MIAPEYTRNAAVTAIVTTPVPTARIIRDQRCPFYRPKKGKVRKTRPYLI